MNIFDGFLICLLFLSAPGLSQSLQLNTYQVSSSLESTLSVVKFPESMDRCDVMRSTNNSIQHMVVRSWLSVLEEWPDSVSGSLVAPTSQWNFSFNARKHAVQYNSTRRATVYNSFQEMRVYHDLGDLSSFETRNFSTEQVARKVFMWDNTTFVLNQVGNFTDYLNITNHTASTDHFIVFPSLWGRVAFTPDHRTVIYWSPYTLLTFYDLRTHQLTGFYSGVMTTSWGVTDYMSFNQEGTLTVIETDALHPITILRVAGVEVVGQYWFNGTIHRATFINDDLILIVTATSLYTLDTKASLISLLSTLSFSYVTSEWDSNKDKLYLCYNNTIRVFKLTAVALPGTDLLATDQPPTDQSQIDQPSTDWLEMSQFQEQATQFVEGGLQISSAVGYTLVVVALSNPFTYYFLTFISFFIICSHYALIDMVLPLKLKSYLQHSYIQVNTNAISWIWQMPFTQLTSEKVTRSSLLEIGLTTDVAVGQSANLLMALFNILLFIFIRSLVRKLGPRNFFRVVFYKPKSEIMYGQFAALIMPLTSPWIYFIYGGAINLLSKINLLVLCVTLGLIIFGISMYLVNLIDLEKDSRPRKSYINPSTSIRKLVKEKALEDAHKSRVRFQQQGTKQVRTVDLSEFKKGFKKPKVKAKRLEKQPISKVSKNYSTVLELNIGLKHECIESQRSQRMIKPSVTAETIDMWLTVLSNFVYPLLLVSPWVNSTLLLLMIVSMASVVNASKLKEHRKNRTVLACYPTLFHVCFIILRFTSKNSTIVVYTQILSFAILLVGSIHHVLFLIYELITIGLKSCQRTKSKGVTPISPLNIQSNHRRNNTSLKLKRSNNQLVGREDSNWGEDKTKLSLKSAKSRSKIKKQKGQSVNKPMMVVFLAKKL